MALLLGAVINHARARTNEESDEVVENALIGHLLPSLRISAIEHRREEILSIVQTSLCLPTLQHFIRSVSQDLDILGEFAIFLAIEPRRRRYAASSITSLGQERAHRLDEWVKIIMVEAVETEVHGGQGNSVECKSCEVLGDHDRRVGTMACPFEDELAGDVVHPIVHVS